MARARLGGLISLALMALSGLSCTRQPRDYLSFVDRFTAENIVKHPSLRTTGQSLRTTSESQGDLSMPSGAFFFQDGSFATNPGQVRQKIVWENQVWSGLSACPDSVYEFPVRLNRRSVLEFGYLCLPRSGAGDRIGRLHISLVLRTPKAEKILFAMTWDGERSGARKIRFEKIRFPANVPVPASLVFSTRLSGALGDEGSDIPVWIHPHLYTEGTKAENIILVSLDTVRRDFLGVYGNRPSLTPHLDKLAGDAVVFENAFSQSTWTLPSHASLLTGLNVNAHQAVDFQSLLPPDVPFLPLLLKARGFLTFAFTGDGAISHKHGFSRGFDLYKEDDGIAEPDSSRQVFLRAGEFIAANKRKNFFLFLHTLQFHDPLESPADILSRFFPGREDLSEKVSLGPIVGNRKKYRPLEPRLLENIRLHYAAEMKTIDEHLIGPLVGVLKKENLYDRTGIVIVSDHGEELFEHGGWAHGRSTYNEIVRVPLIVKLPFSAHAGLRIAENVGLIDVLPTLMESIGHVPPPGLDGSSLMPLIEGRRPWERTYFSDFWPLPDRPMFPRTTAVIHGHFKLIAHQPLADWKLHFDYPPPAVPEFELFDLRADPGETRNVISREAAMADFLMSRLAQYRGRKGSPAKAGPLDDVILERLKALGYL